MADFLLSADDRRELLDAHIQRFRGGEIGPYTFRGLCEQLGMVADEISGLLQRYVNDHAEALHNCPINYSN